MKYIIIALSFVIPLCLVACHHPIEITGNGYITSASGNRDCYLEDYKTGKDTCTKNPVIGGHLKTYYAIPREGWKFNWWESCQTPIADTYSFNAPQETVIKAWGATFPALIANFSQTPVSGGNTLYYTAGNHGVVGPLDPTSEQSIDTYRLNILGGLADLQIVNGELYAIKSYGSSLHKINCVLKQEYTIGATNQLADDTASLLSADGKLYGVYG